MNNFATILKTAVFFTFLLYINHGNSQSIEFEELNPIPHVRIKEVFVSPQQNIFVISNNDKIFRSFDKGENWTEVTGIPLEYAKGVDVYFLESGQAIFSINTYKDNIRSHSLYIYKDGAYVDISPDGLSDDYRFGQSLSFHKNTINIYDAGILYQSTDLGATFTQKTDPRINIGFDQLFVTNDKIFVKKFIDSGFSNPVQYLDVYDKDFNFLYKGDMEFDFPPDFKKFPTQIDNEGQVVFIHDITESGADSDFIYYSIDGGRTYLKKAIEDEWSYGTTFILDNYFYYEEGRVMYRILMDEFFESNAVEEVKSYSTFLFDFSGHISIERDGFDTFTFHDFKSEESIFVNTIQLPSNTVRGFSFRENGDMLAVVGAYVFESKDESKTWEQYHRFTNYGLSSHLNSNGSIVYFDNNNEVIEVIDQDSIVKWEFPASQEELELGFGLKGFSVNDGQYRVLFLDDGFFYYVSRNGSNFLKYFSNERISLGGGNLNSYNAQLIDDKIFVFNRSSGFDNTPLFSLDPQNRFQIDMINELNSIVDVNTFDLSVYMTSTGEVFGHPNFGRSGADSIPNLTSYHASDLDLNFENVGSGPAGDFYHNEKYQVSFVVRNRYNTVLNQYESHVFIRNAINENFVPLNIINRDFENIYSFAFDNQDRLVMTVDDGRILRADISALRSSTSLSDVESVSFGIYPNPIEDYINIEFQSNVKGSLAIYNINGQEVMNKDIDTKQLKIDLKSLNSGTYIISIENENGQYSTQKFIKK